MEISWGQQERFKVIERHLFWGRHLKARMIMDACNISRFQAGLDIKRYAELCPGNILPYTPADRCYRPSSNFVPRFITDDPLEIMRGGNFSSVEGADVQVVPIVRRHVREGVIPIVLSAIDAQCGMTVLYASTTTPLGRKRTLHPSTLVYAGNRLHIRAFCPERGEHRDFVLSRFLNVPRITDALPSIPEDSDWMESIDITLGPNPALPEAGQTLIANEYQLKKLRPIRVRKALVHYFMQFNAMPCSREQMEEANTNPWAYPVVPENVSDLLCVFFN